MNSSNDDFEERLTRQTFRPLPSEWRNEILEAARHAGARARGDTRPYQTGAISWREFLRDLLWPAPAAWGALAGVWVVLLAFRLATAEPAQVIQPRTAPPTPGILTALKEQQQLWAELQGSTSATSRKPAPRPQSRNESAYIQTI